MTRERLLREAWAYGVPTRGAGNLNGRGGTWRAERVKLEGCSVVRYTCEYPSSNFRVRTSIWFDPRIRHLVRMEIAGIDPATGQVIRQEVRDQYSYDEEAPAGTFDLPAPGTRLKSSDTSGVAQDVTGTLSAEEKAAIEEALRRSDAAWVAGDFEAFASAWCFEWYARDARPDRSYWESDVTRQAGRWDRWECRVLSIHVVRFIAVEISVMGFDFVEAPGTLRVKAAFRAEWGEPPDAYEGEALYYLRRESDGYRVVHWGCPFEEIRIARARSQR